MNQDTVNELRRFFAALSHEDRMRIAGLLADREASLQQLASELRIPDIDISRHLSVLINLGIVRTEEQGSLTVYRLDVHELRERRKALLARGQSSSPPDDHGTDESDRTVLANFFEGEQLKAIPATLGKRMVILRWLAGRFEPGVCYPERAVNDILKRHHPDFAYLRRELVDRHFMCRDAGFYWLAEEELSA